MPHGLLSLISPTLAAPDDDGWWTQLWFRSSGSTFAWETDAVYHFIFFVSAISFVIVIGALIWFSMKYTGGRGTRPTVSPAHNTKVEIIWSVIPAIGFVAMFAWGLKAYIPKLVPPADAEEVYVTAYKWNWELVYRDGVAPLESQRVADKNAAIFAFPVDRPVKLLMTSKDVIHSFSIPGFRVKRDVFPNRYTTLWFQAEGPASHTLDVDGKLVAISAEGVPLNTEIITDPDHPLYGTSEATRHGYYLFCTEYCGDQHSQMGHRVATLSPSDYEAWIEAQRDTSGIPLVELGKTIYSAKGCAACHSVDGSGGSGPSWKNIWGETHQFTDGTSEVVDFNYIRTAILEPNDKIVQGYAAQMPTYQGQFTDRELLAVTLYIKSLSDRFASEAEEQSVEAAAAIEAGDADQQAELEAQLQDALTR